MTLAERIRTTRVATGEIAIFYLAQAGFGFKTSRGTRIFLDPYLTDSCERLFGFKRLIPAVMTPDEVEAEIMVSTHSHADHLDPDALPVFARRTATFFIGAPDCEPLYQPNGIPSNRYAVLRAGQSRTIQDIVFRAVYADHGELAPEAVGIVMQVDGLTIYNVGDSAYQPDRIQASLNTAVDVMISPINGAFGNMDAKQTCQLAALLQPRLLIACHYGMFEVHGGDPQAFLECARTLPKSIRAMVMAPGEQRTFSRNPGVE